jgi:hypothetical protein
LRKAESIKPIDEEEEWNSEDDEPQNVPKKLSPGKSAKEKHERSNFANREIPSKGVMADKFLDLLDENKRLKTY